MIFDVQRYSTHDGPGIRTIVFLKGCSLRCQWCSNPESQRREPEILFDAKRCIGCRSCLDARFGGAMHEVEGKILPDRTKAVPADLATVCPSLAIRVAGRGADVESLVSEVVRDKIFFSKSGGGVTFSGGEPLDQAEFLLRCIERLEAQRIAIAIETCLAVDPAAMMALLAHPIEWLIDVKHVDEAKFLLQTSGHVDRVIDNIRLVARAAEKVTFRIPLIPGFNDSEEEQKTILDFIASLERASSEAVRVDILPYHELAAGKYHQLGRANPYGRGLLGPGVVDQWRQAAADCGFQVNLGG